MSNVVSIIRDDGEELVEKYFNQFLIDFHQDSSNKRRLIPFRKTIRTGSDYLLKVLSESTSDSIIILGGNKDIERNRLIYKALEDKIYKHLDEYRSEHCSKIKIMVNNILGG